MIELHSIEYDARLRAICVNARCSYDWFLKAISGAEKNLAIQRQIIRGSKAYATLRADLRRGCVLPPIVLALREVPVSGIHEEFLVNPADKGKEEKLLDELRPAVGNVEPDRVYIIDGLQRTNAIKQTLEELQQPEQDTFLAHRLRLEMWINIPFGALAYRMLLLNAGQKPMSIKHQVEILSMKLREELSSIPRLEIITSIEARRRTQKGQFHLSKLAQCFQAWLQGQPNVDLRNLVMEQMLAEAAIETLGASLKGERPAEEKDSFREFVTWLVAIDHALGPEQMEFLSAETVLQGISAAVGAAERNEILRSRKDKGLAHLLSRTIEEGNTDPLGIGQFEILRTGIDPSRVNVGQATRDMVYRAFQEYFLADGTKTMDDCWRFAAG